MEQTRVNLEKTAEEQGNNEPTGEELSLDEAFDTEAKASDSKEPEDIDPALRPLTGKEEAAFNNLRRYSHRMRLLARILAIALIIFLFFAYDWFWAFGGLLGALVVEGNLSILHYALVRSRPDRVERPLWMTILKFFLLFGATLLVSTLIILLGLAQPFGFLAGIMVFIPAFVATLSWCGMEYLIKGKGSGSNAKKATS
jgi:hypothetical protein